MVYNITIASFIIILNLIRFVGFLRTGTYKYMLIHQLIIHHMICFQADDLLFCYRWLLLEMKREFAFDDALRMLEVMWSSLPPAPPQKELALFEQEFMRSPPVPSPRPKENAYTKVCTKLRLS